MHLIRFAFIGKRISIPTTVATTTLELVTTGRTDKQTLGIHGTLGNVVEALTAKMNCWIS